MAKGGRYARKKEKKPFGAKKIVLIVVCVLLVLIVAAVIAGLVYYNSMLNLLSRPGAIEMESMSAEEEAEMLGTLPTTEETTEATTEPTTVPTETLSPEENLVNIMLIGQASRHEDTSRLSDTMMLCSINRAEKTLTLTSFQRDMRVVIPAYAGHTQGFNRMNVVYHLGSYWTGEISGSMEMMELAVEQNFGVKIDHTVEVDFVAFEKVVNLLGGIEVELTEAQANYMNTLSKFGVDVEVGYNLLDGYEALTYARMRKVDSDWQRTSRQREVITQLLKKCITMDLATANNLLKEVLPLVTTDMTNEEITGYVIEFLPMLADLDMRSQTVPFDGTWTGNNIGTEDVPNYVIDANLQKNKQMLMESLGLITSEEK